MKPWQVSTRVTGLLAQPLCGGLAVKRGVRPNLIGPVGVGWKSRLARWSFKKDKPGHGHNDCQPLPARKAFAQHRHGNQHVGQ